jgi:hypothetical protein
MVGVFRLDDIPNTVILPIFTSPLSKIYAEYLKIIKIRRLGFVYQNEGNLKFS